MKKNFLICLIVAFSLSASDSMSSGSGVGNGGDPLFYYLEATRYSFVETLKLLALDPAENQIFCHKPELSDAQKDLCQAFLRSTIEEILTLNQGTAKTQFVLREETLWVIGPDGQPMPVAAKTQSGPEGAIEFHRISIKLYSPHQALFLIAHEFGHKALFQNHYLTDNEPAPPFSTGRELIDHVAHSIVEVAKRRGKIGTQYHLKDHFDCRILYQNISFGSRVYSMRSFQSEDLMSYVTSLSKNPTDPGIYLPETPTTLLTFRVEISEPANCKAGPKYTELRKTRMQVLRQPLNQNNGSGKLDEEILVTEELLGYSPICSKEQPEFGLEFQQIRFKCKYIGTSGDSR